MGGASAQSVVALSERPMGAGCDQKLITDDLLYRTTSGGVSWLGRPVPVVRSICLLRCGLNGAREISPSWFLPYPFTALPACLCPSSQNCYLPISAWTIWKSNVIFGSCVWGGTCCRYSGGRVCSTSHLRNRSRSLSNSVGKFVYRLFAMPCCLQLLNEGSRRSSAMSLRCVTNTK